MIRLISILAVFFASSVAFAQAGTDCSEQADLAVENCEGRITSARASNVSGGDGTGITGGGAQAQAAYQVRERITQAVSSCNQRDREICVNQCNAAARDAQAKHNSALFERIKQNVRSCSDRIDREIAKGESDANALSRFASASNNSADAGCAEGETCGTPDPNVQQASSIQRDANNNCPQGMYWAARFNQCAGIGGFKPRDMIPTPFGR